VKHVVIPGLVDIRAEDRFRRESAFIGAPVTLCEHEVKEFNPFHLNLLSSIEPPSPFIVGGPVDVSDLAIFIHVVSVGYPRHRTAITKRFAKIDREEYLLRVNEVTEYLDDAMCDAPSGGDGQQRETPYCLAADLVDMIAEQYGWEESDILSIPFVRLWQYYYLISARKAGKAPPMAGKVKQAWTEWRKSRSAL